MTLTALSYNDDGTTMLHAVGIPLRGSGGGAFDTTLQDWHRELERERRLARYRACGCDRCVTERCGR